MNTLAFSTLTRRLGGWLAALACSVLLAGPLFAAEPQKAAEHPAPAAVEKASGDTGHVHASTDVTLVKRFAYSYLTAYMFFLSLCLGGLFLVILHHLFDAMWSVPTRRICEHLASLLFPWMLILFLPILANALWASPENMIFEWMDPAKADHALHVKAALFNKTSFVVVSLGLFVVWGWLGHRLRHWSLVQDKAQPGRTELSALVFPEHIFAGLSGMIGASFEANPQVRATRMMRIHAAYGIFLFALSLTLACIFWMKSLMHQFFSTMYGVYYFAGSVWTTLATLYVLTLLFKRRGPLAAVAGHRQFHDIGVLFFAFTVFYAYIHFSQYFLIWNGAIPEETFWYVLREKGGWWWIGQLIIFGHFFAPFLVFLRIDTKVNPNIMVPFAAWAWLMHYLDMTFNIMPKIYPDGPNFGLFDLVSLAVIGGLLCNRFFAAFYAHPPYPQQDPRIAETMGVYHPVATAISGGLQEDDDIH